MSTLLRVECPVSRWISSYVYKYKNYFQEVYEDASNSSYSFLQNIPMNFRKHPNVFFFRGFFPVKSSPEPSIIVSYPIFTTAFTIFALSRTLLSIASWMLSKSKTWVTIPFRFTFPAATASMAIG